MTTPQIIKDRLTEINQIIDEHPQYIPLPVIAKLLGANAEGLRRSIENGQCPFGIAWQKTIHGNRAFKIPTLTFYLWYTKGAAFQ
ncbi:MAG: hypothetical protein CVU97_05880 [Firmicutes bacterium HGW-Firmicutes-21]|nr:MAG: hypothetical protein CVU97_05880 [Firmicutes bacterium HGW-Firmicutes-21]